MSTSMKRGAGLARAASLAGLLAWTAGAAAQSAQGLQDPTRPPAAAAAPQSGAEAPPAQPQLQSVLLGQAGGARRIAVIDGESVRVGESFHGARVVRIADDEVELRRGRERQVLRLYAANDADGMRRVAPAGRRLDKGEQ